MPLEQKQFLDISNNRNVIWIDPAKVEYSTGSKWPVGKHKLRQLNRFLPLAIVNMFRPSIKRREPFIIPSEHFGKRTRVAETGHYRKVDDLIQNIDNIPQSLWHQELVSSLQDTGKAQHKNIVMTNTAQIDNFFQSYVLPLVIGLKTKGYNDPQGGYESSAVIDEDGTICKTGSGNHRFCICKSLNIKEFPLRIVGAHANWAPIVSLEGKSQFEDIVALLKDVETAHR